MPDRSTDTNEVAIRDECVTDQDFCAFRHRTVGQFASALRRWTLLRSEDDAGQIDGVTWKKKPIRQEWSELLGRLTFSLEPPRCRYVFSRTDGGLAARCWNLQSASRVATTSV